MVNRSSNEYPYGKSSENKLRRPMCLAMFFLSCSFFIEMLSPPRFCAIALWQPVHWQATFSRLVFYISSIMEMFI